jgi:hypothetical protein
LHIADEEQWEIRYRQKLMDKVAGRFRVLIRKTLQQAGLCPAVAASF